MAGKYRSDYPTSRQCGTVVGRGLLHFRRRVGDMTPPLNHDAVPGVCYRGTLLVRNCHPWDHRRALGMVLLYVPWRRQFLMSEVPLQARSRDGGLRIITGERGATQPGSSCCTRTGVSRS